MTRLKALLFSLLIFAFGGPIFAQEQGGSIQGVVKDASGSVIPGATVEAKAAAGSTFSTTSGSDGAFRFPSLPAGKYTVTATLPGFTTARFENVTLSLGQTLRTDFSLKVGGQTEQVEVTAEAPIVDMKQTARITSFRDEAITKMPKGRDFTSLVTQSPGANSESKLGGISIDGASGAENRYIIDGAETTNLQNGTSGKALITDFVDEVEVKSSGYTAEYGGATGGIINAVTKSGTNAWRGEVGGYFSSNSLSGDSRPVLRISPSNATAAEYITYPKDDSTRLEPGFQIGGPLKSEKLWFFAGYQPALIDTDRTVNPATSSNTGAATISKSQKTTVQYLTSNITAQLSQKFRARIAYNRSTSKTEGLLPALGGTSAATSNFDVTSTFPNQSISGNVDYVRSSSHFMSVRGGYYLTDAKDEGIFQGPRYLFSVGNVGQAGVPAQFQQATGYSTVPTNNARQFDKQKRLSVQFDNSNFFSAKGQHAFKFGVQLDRVGNEVLSGETGNLVRLQWNRTLGGARGTYGYYQVRSNGVNAKQGFITQGDVSSNNIGLFVQDAWSVTDRLTINLGLRSEREDVPSFTSADGTLPVAIHFSFKEKLAPRLGAAWDVKGDGKWKVAASWGVFYDITKLELPRGSFGGDKWLEYYYTLDTPDWTNLVGGASCPPACPGTLLRGPIDFRHPSNAPGESTVDPDMKPFKLQEAVVGIEHEFSSKISLSARYVHKQVDTAIEDVGSLDAQGNEIYTIGNPGFGAAAQTGFGPAFPKAVRDYDSVEFTFNKRMADNWSLRASYLWSRLYGNYSGLAQSDENGRTSPNVGRGFDYPLMAFGQDAKPVYGLLATDRPHQFKTQFIYDTFVTAGLNFYAASGIPITREAAFITGSGFPIQYLGRNSDGRTPFFTQLDLFLQKELKLSGDRRIVLNVNVLNLLDQDTVTNRNPTYLGSGQQVNISEPDFFKGFDAQALIAAQRLVLNPLFLKDSEFQGARAIRLGAKFIF